MWQPGWEESLGENGYMYMYGKSPCCPPEVTTTLLLAILQYKIKSLKNKQKNKQKGYWDLKVQETKEEHTFKICYTAKTLNATHYNLHIK